MLRRKKRVVKKPKTHNKHKPNWRLSLPTENPLLSNHDIMMMRREYRDARDRATRSKANDR